MYLSEHTAVDLDKRVTRILHDLGDPPPPLKLEDVRELLKLDLAYYSSSDESTLKRTIHNLKFASKQIINRPSLLFDVIKKFDLKALFVYDKKRIYINNDLPELKQRWGEGHEISHSIIPWHANLSFGDDNTTLTPACHAQIEAEANYACGRLLFLQDLFVEMLNSDDVSISAIRKLSKQFGNTITTTLWRAVEYVSVPMIAIVSDHPQRPSDKFDAKNPCRYFIRSRQFIERFGQLTEFDLFAQIKSYCSWRKGGPLGSEEVVLADDRGRKHSFYFETFFNSYDALTLGTYKAPKPKIILARDYSSIQVG